MYSFHIVENFKSAFCVDKPFQVEISRSDEVLFDHLTLKEVARIYGRYGKVDA